MSTVCQWIFLFVLGLLWPLGAQSHAQKALKNPGEYPNYIIDTNGDLSFDQVLSMPWTKHTQKNPSFGWSQSVIWISTEIEKSDAEPQVLELAYSLLDQVDVWIYKDQNLIKQLRFGKTQARSRELLDDVEPAFLLPDDIGHYRLVFRIQSGSSLQLPLKIYDRFSYDYKEKEDFFITGSFAGILGIMALYNFLIFLSSRNRSYFYYSCFTVSFVAVQLSMSGHLGSYLWPGEGHVTDLLICQGSFIANIFMVLFADSYLGFRQKGGVTRHMTLVLLGLLSLGLCASFFLLYTTSVKIIAVLAAGGSISVLCLAFRLAILGQREAKFYCAAWIALIGGGLVFIAKSFGLLPINIFTNYAFRIGSVFEVALLSLALADQLNQLRAQLASALEGQIAHLQLQEKIASEREIYEKNLRFETEQRLGLAANVAHRLNNPLNYLSLGRDTVGFLNQDCETKLSSIFSAQDGADPEVEALHNSFHMIFQQYKEALQLMTLGINKASLTVRELKILSGIDRPTLEDLRLNEIYRECLERVQESLGTEELKRLTLSPIDQTTLVRGNPILVRFALERLIVSLLGSQVGPIMLSTQWKDTTHWQVNFHLGREPDPNFLEALQKSLFAILHPSFLSFAAHWENGQLHCSISHTVLPASPMYQEAS